MRDNDKQIWYIDMLPDDQDKGTLSKMVKGVPYTKIPYTREYHPHATNIACFVIRNHNIKSADWLLDNMGDDGAIWHHFVFPFYDHFKNSWVGGLAQGLTISALVDMYEETQEKQYIEGAKKAFNGLISHCIDKFDWIYEYPKVPSILNGNIYAILGIHSIIDYFPPAELFFKHTVKNICKHLHCFDMGYWSLYDLEKKIPATFFYHDIHIELLRALHKYSSEAALHKYMVRFESYKRYRWEANIVRLWKIWRMHGTLKLYNRYQQRRRWMVEC